jgi:hypothetical protein
MIREFIARLRTRAKEIAKALFEKIGTAIRKYTPSHPASAGIHTLIVVMGSGNALHAGIRNRYSLDITNETLMRRIPPWQQLSWYRK